MRLWTVYRVLTACLLMVFGPWLPAYAQTLPANPSEVQPAVSPVDPRSRVLPQTRLPTLPPVNAPAYRGVIPQGAESVTFTPTEIQINGATVLNDTELQRPFRDLLGRTASLEELYGAANALQAEYRRRGYILTRVVVPQQRIANGVVRVLVVEGFISRVVLQGRVGAVSKLIERYLTRLTELRPVRAEDIERYMLLVNDIPGISATGVLRADTGQAGAAQLIAELRSDDVDHVVSINNRGSRFTGPWSLAYSMAVNSHSERGDRFAGFFYVTPETQDGSFLFGESPSEQIFALLSYDTRIGTEGLRLNLELSNGVSNPGFTLAPLEIENKVVRANAELTYPIIRSRRQNLDIRAEFEYLVEQVRIGQPVISRSEDRLAIIALGGRYEFGDSGWGGRQARTELSLDVRQGLPILGATDEGDNRSRPDGRAVFTALRLRLEREQSLSRDPSGRFQLHAALEGQYALNTLLSQAEFRIGGDNFGRAFEPSELAGEHGVGVSVELRYNGLTPFERVETYQAYVFYDWGLVANLDEGFKARESLASAGAGIRLVLNELLFVELEYARTLNKELGSDPGVRNRFLARMTAQF